MNKMSIILQRVPPKCYSCGKDIGQLQENFQNLVSVGNSNAEAMDALGIDNYCCRTNFISPGILAAGLQFSNPLSENTSEANNVKIPLRMNCDSILFMLTKRTEVDPGQEDEFIVV